MRDGVRGVPVVLRPVLMGTEYTSKKSAHALSELKNVKNPIVMGTKYAWKKVKVNIRISVSQDPLNSGLLLSFEK